MDDLLQYYESEIDYFRALSLEFAKKYPKIGARLGIDQHSIRDASAEHIVQSVSLLNARIRKKIDDDFPEIVDGLFDIIFPHFLRPIPSFSLVQLARRSQAGGPDQVQHIAPGSLLETVTDDGASLHYRTCYPVDLWPLRVTQAVYKTRSFEVSKIPLENRVDSVLELTISIENSKKSFPELGLDRLPLYLNFPQLSAAGRLYELFFQHLSGIAVLTGQENFSPLSLPVESVRPIGFAADEAIIPDVARSFTGYRLLTEYFCFPQKYLFIEIGGLAAICEQLSGQTLTLQFYFSELEPLLESRCRAESFLLNCTPVVNLFPATASSILMTPTKSEYRVVPQTNHEAMQEIYSIEQVSGMNEQGDVEALLPLFGARPEQRQEDEKCWHLRRREVEEVEGGRGAARTEHWLSLVDFRWGASGKQFKSLHLRGLAFNRDLPNRYSRADFRPHFRLMEFKNVDVSVLITPTPTRRRGRAEFSYWQLLSHLSLNYLSLESEQGRPDTLQQLLTLYNPVKSSEVQNQILAMTRMNCEMGMQYLNQTLGGFCRGVHVTMEMDESHFTGSSCYLFGAVLEHFLSLYVHLNSYTQLTVTTARLREKGLAWKWPAKSGGKALM